MPMRVSRLLWSASLALLAGVALLAASPDHPAGAQGSGSRAWRQQAVWSPGFDSGALLRPQGVAAGPGDVFYVADYGHDRVVVLNPAGAVVRSFGQRGDGDADLMGPTDVAVDSARDRVYVVDRGNKRLSVFTLAGQPVARWTRAGPEYAFVPWAVAVAPATGDVYVISTQIWPRVEHFAADGQWQRGWGDVGPGPGQFRNPQDIAVHPDGRVLVADSGNARVQIFSVTGAQQGELRPLPGVRSVAVDATDGRIFALHSLLLDPPSHVTVYSSAGSLMQTIDSQDLPGGFSPGSGLAVGTDGRLAVTIDVGATDGRQGLRVWSLAPAALLTSAVTSPLDYAGFYRPEAIAVAPSGELYVAEGLLQVVRRYGADGAFSGLVNGAVGQELGFGPAGELYTVNDGTYGGAVSLRRIDANGQVRWTKTCDCLSGMGITASADRVYATDAFSRTVAAFDQTTNNDRPVARVGLPGAPYGTPLDLERGPDGLLYVAGGDSGQVHVVDPATGAQVRAWPAGGGGAERISVGPDGTVFALRLEGSVAAFAADGALEDEWSPAAVAGAAVARPADVAAGPNGRVYVLDGESYAVIVYEPAGGTLPTPAPTAQPPCTVRGDKTASPGQVALGAEVTVELSLDITCQAGTETRADVMLIVDRSGSMAGKDPPTKLDKAKEAADGFVRRLDLGRHRVGLVSFESINSLDQPLTGDLAAIRGAIAAVQPSGSTDIAGATERAVRHLRIFGRPGAVPVVLLLTDGEPSGPRQAWVDAVRAAGRARGRGALVYTIGLGDNVKADLLTAMAGAPDRYFFAPTADDLDPIYQELSQVIGEVVASDVVVTDSMGPDVDFVPGSAPGAFTTDNRLLTWSLGTLPAGGQRLTLRVKPRVAGLLPTNTEAFAHYTAAGQRYRFTFPLPRVEVLPPATDTPTATATPTTTPTATATRRPTATATPVTRHTYLPIAMRGACRPSEARLGADIVLALDTSTSMTGLKLTSAVLAAKLFLTEVDPGRDRVGLVAFDSVARREHSLTGDLAAVGRSLDALRVSEGTYLEGGLREAWVELSLRARPGSQRVVVLLSDGQPTVGSAAGAVAQAEAMKRDGLTLFSIGLGADVDAGLMRQLASGPNNYFYAPTPDQLAEIYRRIAGNLPCR